MTTKTPLAVFGGNADPEVSTVTWPGQSAPAVAPSGQGRLYFDSAANTFKVSQNGSAYADLLGGGLTGAGANGEVTFWIGGSALSSNAGFRYDGAHLYLDVAADSGVFEVYSPTGGVSVLLTLDTANNMVGIGKYPALGALDIWADENQVGNNGMTLEYRSRANSGSAKHALQVTGQHSSSTQQAYLAIIEANMSSVGPIGTFAGLVGRPAITGDTTNIIGVLGAPSIQWGTQGTVYGFKAEPEVINAPPASIGTLYGFYSVPLNMSGVINAYGAAIGSALTQAMWLVHDMDPTTAAQGMAFGQSRDTVLFRSAANTLRVAGTFSPDILDTPGTAAPAVSASGHGKVYFDSGSNTFKVSQHGGAFVDLVASTTLAVESIAISGTARLNPSAVPEIVLLTGASTPVIKGISGGVNGARLVVVNVGATDVTLLHQSVTEATAANRIITGVGADYLLAAGQGVEFIYETTNNRWHKLN